MEAEEENNDYTGHKILIIGPAEAGKTTFVKRYVTGLYNANALYKMTIGGKYGTLSICFFIVGIAYFYIQKVGAIWSKC